MSPFNTEISSFISMSIAGSALQCYQCTTSDEGCEDVDHQNFPSYNLTCNDTQFDHPVRGEVNVTNTMCMSIRTVPRRKKEGDVEPVLGELEEHFEMQSPFESTKRILCKSPHYA